MKFIIAFLTAVVILLTTLFMFQSNNDSKDQAGNLQTSGEHPESAVDQDAHSAVDPDMQSANDAADNSDTLSANTEEQVPSVTTKETAEATPLSTGKSKPMDLDPLSYRDYADLVVGQSATKEFVLSLINIHEFRVELRNYISAAEIAAENIVIAEVTTRTSADTNTTIWYNGDQAVHQVEWNVGDEF